MAEAIAKVLAAFVDALTPKGIRFILVLSLLGLAYATWSNQQEIATGREEVRNLRFEVAKLTATMESAVEVGKQGNAELAQIRTLLMQAPAR